MNLATITTGDLSRGGARETRRHVVHGVLSLELGGLERLVVDLVKIGSRRGDRMSVVCVERRGRLAEQAEALGAEVHCLDKPAGRSTAAVASAAELLKRLAPDVVHTHQIGALWYLGQAARTAGVPAVVHTEHCDQVTQARGWWNKLKNRLRWLDSSRLASRFCCVSDDVARSARRWGTVPASKVEVVLNGIDTNLYTDRTRRDEIRRSQGIPADASVIGTVGRLNEVKRQDLLLKAFAEISGRNEKCWLLIVGDGPERSRLEALAEGLGIHERTAFAGYQARPEWFFTAMDLFALTSRHEGLPLVMLEAWAAGLPVVSSAVGGVPKVMEHGISGLLFDSGDQAALARTLEQVLGDASFSARLSSAGQAVVRARYSLERMADDYDAIYASTISASRSFASTGHRRHGQLSQSIAKPVATGVCLKHDCSRN